MSRSKLVAPLSMFWGFTAFMPVGVPYVAAVLLFVALLLDPERRERWTRVRSSPLFWPVVVYLGWTLIVLAFGAHYPETGSNLGHGIRIAATVLMAMALTREEARWALRGFLLVCAINLLLILAFHTIGLPVLNVWRGILMPVGNKSISNALLFTVLGSTAAVFGLAAASERRPARVLAALALIAVVVIVVSVVLVSRTSLVALLVAMAAACVHQWRRRLKALALALLVVAGIGAVAIGSSPSVQQKFELGMSELEAAQGGTVSEGSWVVRYYMYRDTARMIIDRPLAGWGIGGWTSQWHLRGPKLLADYNMPHNDFLWMGSQAGLPGSLSLLAIMLVALWQAWKRPDLPGRQAFGAMLVLLVATSLNSALRDAQIGLSLLWVAMIYLRLALAEGDGWQGLLPHRPRAQPASPPHIAA